MRKQKNIKFIILILLAITALSVYYNNRVLSGSNSPNYRSINLTNLDNQSSGYLLKKLDNINYFRGIQISQSSINGTCQLPVLIPWNNEAKKLLKITKPYNKCEKHTPLSYIHNNRLFINQTVNTTYYSGALTDCKLATVVRNSIKKEYYVLGEFIKIIK